MQIVRGVHTSAEPAPPFEKAEGAQRHVASAVAVAGWLAYAAPTRQTVTGVAQSVAGAPVAGVAAAEKAADEHGLHVTSADAVAAAEKKVPAGHGVETATQPPPAAYWSLAQPLGSAESVQTREEPEPEDVAPAAQRQRASEEEVAATFA